MALKLMYITNHHKIARIAEECGVDWIFIDLELNGKVERQGHLDTVISRHSIEDIRPLKKALKKAELLVRINPIYENSREEIDRVIHYGADIIMLPYFKKKEEVDLFVKYINGRAKVCLLCETAEAVENIDSILSVRGIDYVHIGLNDLHLSYNMKFMFELLADGTVEKLCRKFREKGITYGFGGIARLGEGILPADNIIAEHYRLESELVILSRSFFKPNEKQDLNEVTTLFRCGVNEIRELESKLSNERTEFFEENRLKIEKIVKNQLLTTN